MSWNSPFEHPDSRRRMAELVDEPGFSVPLPFDEPDAPLLDPIYPTPAASAPPQSHGSTPKSFSYSPPATVAPPPVVSRLLQGPYVMDGDLCDVMPGQEAIVLVSPRGEKILLQNEGRVTFHVPSGWRILVGSKPLRADGMVKRFVRVGESVEEVEDQQSMLCLDNIPELYREADPFGPKLKS